MRGGQATGLTTDNIIEGIFNDTKENPELYFNFGFTHNDFRSFLMKLMYCRAIRNFIEKKRLQRIDEYNS